MYKIECAYVPGNWRLVSQHKTRKNAMKAWDERVRKMDKEYPNDKRLVTPSGEVSKSIKGSLMGRYEFS